MPRDKAPDNMPTEAIRRFVASQEQAYAEAVQEEEAAIRKLKVAIHAQRLASDHLGEYKGWLWFREQEEEREANSS